MSLYLRQITREDESEATPHIAGDILHFLSIGINFKNKFDRLTGEALSNFSKTWKVQSSFQYSSEIYQWEPSNLINVSEKHQPGSMPSLCFDILPCDSQANWNRTYLTHLTNGIHSQCNHFKSQNLPASIPDGNGGKHISWIIVV